MLVSTSRGSETIWFLVASHCLFIIDLFVTRAYEKRCQVRITSPWNIYSPSAVFTVTFFHRVWCSSVLEHSSSYQVVLYTVVMHELTSAATVGTVPNHTHNGNLIDRRNIWLRAHFRQHALQRPLQRTRNSLHLAALNCLQELDTLPLSPKPSITMTKTADIPNLHEDPNQQRHVNIARYQEQMSKPFNPGCQLLQ